MAEQQREVPLLQRPVNPDDVSFSWLTVLGFAFLTFNSAMAIYRSDGELYAVVFVAFSYVDLVLLFYCLRQFEKAEANSPAREKLKVAVWVLRRDACTRTSYQQSAPLHQEDLDSEKK